MNQTVKRILMTVIGVLVAGFSAGMFGYTAFGMDPFQVFAHGIAKVVPISFGVLYVIINAILLVVDFFWDRKKLGLGTLINLFLLGFVVDFSQWLFGKYVPFTMVNRIIVLVCAIVIMCFASAFYFTADMGVSTYDAIALTLHEKTHWQFRLCRIGTDLICVAIGFALGEIVGVGTLISALGTGPLVAFFRKHVSEPFLYGKK